MSSLHNKIWYFNIKGTCIFNIVHKFYLQGGDSVQKESDKYIKKNGKLCDGEAVRSKPGRLPCKLLIHAVGPVWRGGKEGEERNLRKAITNSLNLASEDDLPSITLPALSAGIFGYPVRDATEVIVKAIKFFFTSKEGRDSSVKEVNLCCLGQEIVEAFITALQSVYGEEDVEISKDYHPEDNEGRGKRYLLVGLY